MKVTLLAVVTLTAVASFAIAGDPECVYRKLRGLPPHWPNPTNCSSYYRCSKGTVRSLTCPPGKEYNPKNGKCGTAGRGLCKLSLAAPLAEATNVCANEVSGAFLPNPGYCGMFFICNEKLAYPQNCEPGSSFDITQNNCAPDPTKSCWQNQCVNEPNGAWLAGVDSCANYYICANDQVTVQSCSLGSYFDSTMAACVDDVGNTHCWENFCIDVQDGKAVMDPSNCNAFYMCSDEQATLQQCAPGTYFDKEAQTCTEGECTVTDTTTCGPEITTTIAPEPGCDCADGVANGEKIVDRENCRQYYVCVNGVLEQGECELGDYFDVQEQECLTDTENVCCGTSGCDNGAFKWNEDLCNEYFVCMDNVWESATCPGGSFFDNTTDVCVVDTENKCPPCNVPTNCNDGDFMWNEDLCNEYFICVNDIWESATCPGGSFFDNTTDVCVVDTENKCPPCNVPTNCNDGATKLNEENCNEYFVCENDVWVAATCAPTTYFDTKSGECMPDEDNVCPQCNTPANCEDGAIQANEDNCNEYFVCQNNEWVTRTCPEGANYDKDLETCILSADNMNFVKELELISALVECKETEAARSTDNCWSYLACIGGQWINESCVAGYYFDATVNICRRDDFNFCPENRAMNVRSRRSVDEQPADNCTCPGDVAEGSSIPHPTDCAMYLKCVNSELVEESCCAGTVFSSCDNACIPDTDGTCWVCANRPNGYQLTNPADCTGYLVCNEGLAVPQTCQKGQWYNGNDCVVDVTGQCINPCSCGNGNVAHPFCNKYYQCTDGVPQVVDCPAGQAFDPSTGTCSTKVTCAANQCATASDGTAYPVPGDSSIFYVCIGNVATLRSCPANTAFDTELAICTEQPSADCDQSLCKKTNIYSSYPSLTCDNTTFCMCLTDGAFLKTCLAGYSYDPEAAVCTFTGPCDPQICVGAAEYTPSVNYDDPNSFCLCRAGQQVPVPCPIGYTFNSELLVCVVAPQADPRCCRNYCVGKPNNEIFPGLNTDTGFCECIDEVPKFNQCLGNKVFDAELGVCMDPVVEFTCVCNECDSAVCADTTEFLIYPARDSVGGFCYCKEFCGLYSQCLGDTQFDTELMICTAPPGPVVCDATECDTQPEYNAFPSLNGTDGFCYCQGGLPIYRQCLNNMQFSITEKICVNVSNECTSGFCDAEKCSCLANYESFPSSNADDDTSFCYCLDGEAIYDNCLNDKIYNTDENVCMVREAPCSVCEAGKCATAAADTMFPALNTTEGFCMCSEGVAKYVGCLSDKQFDPTFLVCLPPPAKGSKEMMCDPTKCFSRRLLKTFAAEDNTDGFCTCQDDGTATFESCEDEHIYDEILNVCIVAACDPLQCRSRSKFEAYAARNTTKGFCSCDIIPTYYHCTRGHVFDIALNLCLDEETAVVAACDPRDCRGRVQFESFAAKNTTQGFCTCQGEGDELVGYHDCKAGKVFDSELALCIENEHSIQRRSIAPEEKFPCKGNGKRSVPANCSQYEVCSDGNWRRRSCTEERYYNPEQQRCLEPRDDLVCSYARVSGLPPCTNHSESATLPGKENCLQYYRCTAGRWRLRSCPKSHYYVPHLSTCLPMPAFSGDDFCSWINRTELHAAECQHLSVRPYAGSCERFLMCLEHNWWIQQCPLGMYFNRQLNYCLPNDANQCQVQLNATVATACDAGQMRVLASSCRSYEHCEAGQWERKSCEANEQFEPQIGCIRSDGSCQGSGLRRACIAGEVRPLSLESGNCSQFFYRCQADEWQLMNCLRGHSFMGNTNKCQPSDSCESEQLMKSPSSCKGQPDGQSVPHAEDCTRFYLCLQEQPALLQNCVNGSFFDARLGYCRPNDGSCQLKQPICSGNNTGKLIAYSQNCRGYYNCSLSGQDDSQLSYCPDGEYFDNLVRECRLDLGQCIARVLPAATNRSLCMGQPHGSRLPHQLHCNLFYVCVRGLAIPAECEPQMHFNATQGRCELATALQPQQCQLGQLERQNVTATYSCQGQENGSYVPDHRDCSRFYICAGGVAMAQRCAPGSYFDGEQLLCQPDDGYCPYVNRTGNETMQLGSDQPMPPDPLLCEGKHGHIMPDPANCNNFYICVSNKLRRERCYAGHYFNATLQQCQLLEPMSDVEERDPQLESKTEARNLVPELSIELQPPLKCSDAPSDFSQLCEFLAEGTSTADPGDCRRYISCNQQEPISQRCRNGESYDNLLGICRQNDGTCLMENGDRVGECNGKHGQLLQDQRNCRGYSVCVHGQRIRNECQRGYYFEKTTNSCQLDGLQQCGSNGNELAKLNVNE